MRGSMGRFVMGLAWCLVAMLIWATFFTLVFNLLFGGSGIGWRGWFVVGLLLIVGLLIWLETRVIATEALDTKGLTESIPPAVDDYALPVKPGSLASKLAWGPPALLTGFRGIRGKRTRRQEAVFDRAVILVFDLAREPGRVEVKQVMRPPEDMMALAAAVDWLEANDWIGRSTDGGSLWLSTVGQKRLVERKLTGG